MASSVPRHTWSCAGQKRERKKHSILYKQFLHLSQKHSNNDWVMHCSKSLNRSNYVRTKGGVYKKKLSFQVLCGPSLRALNPLPIKKKKKISLYPGGWEMLGVDIRALFRFPTVFVFYIFRRHNHINLSPLFTSFSPLFFISLLISLFCIAPIQNKSNFMTLSKLSARTSLSDLQ